MDDFWSRFLPIEQQGYDFLTDSPCRLDHYDIKLRIRPSQHSVKVAGKAYGSITGPAADEFRFLLGLDYRKPTAASCKLHKLMIDGQCVPVHSDRHMHRAVFPKPRHRGENFEIEFNYSSVPVARKCWVNAQSDWPLPGLADNETELCFEGYWLPFANAQFQPVTFDFDIADMPNTVVIANAKPLGDYTIADERWHRYQSKELTFPTVIAGDFKVFTKPIDGGSFSFYHQTGYAEAAEKVLSTANQIFELFTEWMKTSPQGNLSLIQLARTDWGQYAPFPFVVFPRDDIKKDAETNDWKRISQMLAHEIGHFWFGNLVRSAPAEQWLSEGFAQYFNLLYTEHAFGHNALHNEIQRYVSGLATIDIESQVPLTHITIDHPKQAILVRIKGAIVLHCLRQLLGLDGFITFLETLVHHYRDQLITTANVETAVSQFIGGQDARSFFDLHLRGLAVYTWDPATETIIATF